MILRSPNTEFILFLVIVLIFASLLSIKASASDVKVFQGPGNKATDPLVFGLDSELKTFGMKSIDSTTRGREGTYLGGKGNTGNTEDENDEMETEVVISARDNGPDLRTRAENKPRNFNKFKSSQSKLSSSDPSNLKDDSKSKDELGSEHEVESEDKVDLEDEEPSENQTDASIGNVSKSDKSSSSAVHKVKVKESDKLSSCPENAPKVIAVGPTSPEDYDVIDEDEGEEEEEVVTPTSKEEVAELRHILRQLQKTLLVVAGVTFCSILAYAVYYIRMIKRIYNKERISK